VHDPASWFRKTWFTRRRVRELENGHNSVTVQNRTHVYMKFFHHKDLGNYLLQLCPKVVKHPVYIFIYTHIKYNFVFCQSRFCNAGYIVLFLASNGHEYSLATCAGRNFRGVTISASHTFCAELRPVQCREPFRSHYFVRHFYSMPSNSLVMKR